MPDWAALVDRQLGGLALAPAEKAEVIAELAAHLEEICEELRRQGMTEEEAIGRTLSQVEDWQTLCRRIQSAKTEENVMSSRVKQFWLPSLVTLVLSMGLLALIQIIGPNPWIVARNSKWSQIAPVVAVYLPWLLSLPMIGAMGAYLSIRAGGLRRAVFLSIAFPVLPYLTFFLIGPPMLAILNHHVAQNIMIVYFVGLFAWVLAPGAALVTGGLLMQLYFSRRLTSRGAVSN
jgi:hypothetical protein